MNGRIIGERVSIFYFIIIIAMFSSLVSAETITTDYYFNRPEIADIRIEGDSYQRIIMDDAYNGGEIGHPALPVRGAQILLPQGTKVESIEIVPSQIISIGDDYLIEPVARPFKLSEAPEGVVAPIPDPSIYKSETPYPAAPHVEIGTHGFRGYNILTVALYPMQYIPATGELGYFDKLTVVINTIPSNEPSPLFRGLDLDRQDVSHKIDNQETTDSYSSFARGTRSAYDLLILADPSLVASFQTLKDYHDTTGILTEIHTTTDVGSTDPEDIRDYIRDRYTNDGISYVLIGGDDDLIPAQDLYVMSWDGADNEISTDMPGDIYYACLDGTYNYDGDANWGEPTDGDGGSDVDLVAEVYVGRASVGTTAEADRFVNKTIEYLTTATLNLDSVLMCGEYLGFGGVSDYAGTMMDEMVDGSSANGYTTVGIPSAEYSIDRLYDRDWSGNDWPVSELTDRINNGLHIINHLGHGSTSYALKMTSGNVIGMLTNDDLFFLYSQACYSGQFDGTDGFAEYMNIKTDHGTFAVVMNARYGWGTGYTTDGPSQRFDREFWDAVFNPAEGKPEIGRANHDSKEDNLHRINESCMRWCYYELTLFGDPTVGIRGSRGLLFSYPDGIPEVTPPGQITTVGINVTGFGGGTPVPGSGQLHYSLNGGAYLSAALTEFSPGSYEAVLPGIDCGDQLEFYISVDETIIGTVNDPQPAEAHLMSAGTAMTTAFTDDFETDKGWSISGGQWARGIPTGGGGEYGSPDPTSGSNGPNVFGYNLNGDYPNDMPAYHLTSPVIDCSGLSNIYLEFSRWLGVEGPAYDHALIQISNNGSSWSTVWSNGGEITDASWTPVSLRIAEVADNQSMVYLRWTMGTTDEGWAYCGWNIDDVRISGYQCQSGELVITTPSVSDWTEQHALSIQLQAAGGSGSYTWTDKNGDLVGTGLTLAPDGNLSGTPLAAGTISFTAEVTDEGSNVDEQPFSFTINPPLSIITATLPDWTNGVVYSSQLELTGGTGGKLWIDKYDVLSGNGLTLSALGLLEGIPSASGPISLTAQVTDQVGAQTERILGFEINPPVTITTLSLPVCSTHYEYAIPLSMSGGTGLISWSDKNGDLSGSGFELSPTGTYTGMISIPDTLVFTAQATDELGSTDEITFSIEYVRRFECGDANGDKVINVGDAVFMISHVFKSGPAADPPEAGDANCDDNINVGDAVYLINYVFKSGDAPCCP
ncbi:MAG: hypothetical protein GY841_18465 [FCB group bacterium]|nr:hypothetical protein [FCB group bacterium]